MSPSDRLTSKPLKEFLIQRLAFLMLEDALTLRLRLIAASGIGCVGDRVLRRATKLGFGLG